MSLSPAERQARHYASHRTDCRAQWQRWALSPEGTVTLLLNYARDRARRKSLSFDLDREFVGNKLQAGVCEVSGLPIERAIPGRYRTHPFAPSLDRIEPGAGYVMSNVRLVCFAVNRARSDWGDEVLIKIARAIAERKA